jgi:hypothetical protein
MPPDCKRPRVRDGLEFLHGQMGLPRVVLAPLTGAHDMLCVRDCSLPVEAMPEGFPDHRSRRHVVAAYASSMKAKIT